ncbi:MAG: hypothetical protein ACKV1O_30450 [Saprospiraceae bacterium]
MKNALLIAALACSGWVHAQTDAAMTNSLRDDINSGNLEPSAYRVIYGVPQQTGAVQGDVYLDAAWQKADVWFYPEVVAQYDPKASDKVSGLPVRIDLGNQYVEFKLPEGVKAIEAASIKKIELKESGNIRTFMNTRQYGQTKEMPGFAEVLSDGKITVVKYTKLWLKQPTYNVALNVGERDAKLIKQKDYYLVSEKNGAYELDKFKPGTGSLKKMTKSKAKKVEAYINDNGLDPKIDADLMKILAYYNGLS